MSDYNSPRWKREQQKIRDFMGKPVKVPSEGGRFLAFADGACVPNPGLAAGGAVIQNPQGRTVLRVGRFIGGATSNVAEYEGLLLALRGLIELGAKRARICMDSLLVVQQMKGRWKCRKAHLADLRDEARELAAQLAAVEYDWIPREQNGEADMIAGLTLDRRVAEFRETFGEG